MTTSTSTKDTVQESAATAAGEGKKVAGTALDEAQHVAAEAKAQVSGLVDEAVGQLNDQSRTQRDRMVGTLQTFGDDLEQMASQGGRSGLATDLARELADRARTISSHLDGREPSDLLDDMRSFARRRPGTFLIGAVAAGVLAGRLARGAKASNDAPDTMTTPTPTLTTPTTTPPIPSPYADTVVTSPVSPIPQASPTADSTYATPSNGASGAPTPAGSKPGGIWAAEDPLTDHPADDAALRAMPGRDVR